MTDFLAALPFEWAAYAFMRNALLGVMLVAPLYALLGTVVVDARMAFFSDSLGHSALTGIGLGVIFGLKTPLWSMVLFGALFAVLMIWVKGRGGASADTTIGVFSSTAAALGIVILSAGGGFSKYSWYLVGDILSIEERDIARLLVVLAAVVLFWFVMYNRVLVTGLNAPLAKSRGIPHRAVEMAFAALTAVVVMLSIQWVGVLLINAMLVLPAAAARNLAPNVRVYHAAAIGISLVSGVAGLLISFSAGTASGATIVLVLAAAYAGTLLLRGKALR